MLEIQKVLDKYGEMLVESVKNKLLQGRKSASGNLINSLTYKYSYVNGQYKIQITGASYLINVDRGRRAGAKRPPINAIEAWIKVKRIKVKPTMKPTAVLTKQQNKKVATETAIRGMAFAIANNISKRGIKPFPILKDAQTIINSAAFKNDITNALAADLSKQIKL